MYGILLLLFSSLISFEAFQINPSLSKLATKYNLQPINFSGRSTLIDSTNLSSKTKVKVKYMIDTNRYERECDAYRRVLGKEKYHDAFITTYDKDIITGSSGSSSSDDGNDNNIAILIMESGFIDLFQFCEYCGGIDADVVRVVGLQILESMTRIHSKGKCSVCEYAYLCSVYMCVYILYRESEDYQK